MAGKIPYFKFYPSDFMGGVRGMSAQEIGLYTMLLCRMYEESGPIERDDFRLSTYCGMREATFTKTLEKLIRLGKIKLDGGMMFNGRAGIEISNRANDLEIASRAGKASAEKRQQNQQKMPTGVERALNHTDTNTDTDKKKEEGKPSSQKAVGSRLSDDWFLPRDWGEWAISEGLTSDQIRVQADTFKDYWIAQPGAKGRKSDWQATWRNWIRNSKQKGNRGGFGYSAGKTNANGGRRHDPAIDNILRLAGVDQTQGNAGS